MAIGIMIIFFFGHLYPPSFSLGVMVLSGIGMGFTYAMPYAIVPDAVEYDYLRTGERKEGAFYGIWTFGIKIGQAIAMGITGLVLTLGQYIPETTQSVDSMLSIRLLVGPIPAFIFIAGAVVLAFYPIDEKRYNQICEEIEEMEARM